MAKQKKAKARMPNWLAKTFLVFGLVFLLGATAGEVDMLIIGLILTALAIVGLKANGALPKSMFGFWRHTKTTNIATTAARQNTNQSSTKIPKLPRSRLAVLRDVLLVIVLLPVAIVIIAATLGLGSSSPDKSKKDEPQKTQQITAKPSARGYVDSKRIVAENHLQFVGAVLNNGEVESSFTCHAEASDDNDKLMGHAIVKVPSIKPGEYFSYTVDLKTDKPALLAKYSRLICE